MNILDKSKDIPYYSDVITSKVTSKSQTTIPRPVRTALRVREGDFLEYRIDGRRVILTRHAADAVDDPFKGFDEWASEADRRAYADL